MRDASKKPNIHAFVAVLVIIVGFVLMIGKIVADSEPGGIPILLVLLGTGWYFIQRTRSRSRPN